MTYQNDRIGGPLHLAALVAALLEVGANPAPRIRAGWTVLHEALAAGDCDVVRLVADALNTK